MPAKYARAKDLNMIQSSLRRHGYDAANNAGNATVNWQVNPASGLLLSCRAIKVRRPLNNNHDK